jgi:NADH-quinone oxidoreductase subunit L
VLTGKYYIDELYEAVLGRPLNWISEKVFLRIGDRFLIDGSLDGLAALASRSAGRLSKLQTGNLHLYAFLVLAGIVGALIWSWHG